MKKNKAAKKKMTVYFFLKEIFQQISLIETLALNLTDIVMTGSSEYLMKNMYSLKKSVKEVVKFSEIHYKELIRGLTEKDEEKKIILASIIHDVNNMLSVIIGYVNLMEFDCKCNLRERMMDDLNHIIKASSLAVKIIKADSFSSKSLNLVESIREAINIQRLRKDIKVIAEFPSDRVDIRGNEISLMRIFVNLLRNAQDAIMEKESYLSDQDRTLGIFVQVEKNRCVEVRIVDNGKGVLPSDHDKIFTPGFSTKGGRGTGIGLFSCKEIIEKKLGGKISFESWPGQGTSFRLRIPIVC